MAVCFERKLKGEYQNVTEITLGLLDLFSSKLDDKNKICGGGFLTKKGNFSVELYTYTVGEYKKFRKLGHPDYFNPTFSLLFQDPIQDV